MDEPQVRERMREDWNRRASEDAYYYVAFGRREQDDEEFFSTAADVVRLLNAELPRLRAREAALEIGCGPGRLMRPMARAFGEVHGVDISDEMVARARHLLRDTPNAHPHHGSGSDLSLFADEKFDFVYSYAVFQHIPSREVVFNYLREARRVLKTGGVLRCQINGLPPTARQYDTWSGVRITPEEIHAFAREHDFQLLALDPIWTQYMWITLRKRPSGWQPARGGAPSAIRRIGNALTGEAVAPSTGPSAALSLWIEDLPDECDLNRLEITADGHACRVSYVGERLSDGITQVNAALPAGIRTGVVAIEVRWLGAPLTEPSWVRVMAAGPAVPRIQAVTDGVNLISGSRVDSGTIKIAVTDLEDPARLRVTLDEQEVAELDSFCTDPVAQRYEFNFDVPRGTAPGAHVVRIRVGRREFPPYGVEIG